jgi:flavin reductase (DIM6/NTAB) family NADH-FMN oxidoreductase RutF
MKRPWNRINPNVYSLMTSCEEAGYNMNICTYVSVVNIKPKIYLISIDKSTLTYKNLTNKPVSIVLQSLSIKNIKLVKLLGKKSGFTYNKQKFLENRKLTSVWKGNNVLNDCCFLIELHKLKEIHEMNDHCIFTFEVKSFENISDDFLLFQSLIENKIIL